MSIVLSKDGFLSNFTGTKNSSEQQCHDQWGMLTWSVISGTSACVGVPASVWLLWVLVQRHRSGLANDIYMLNLTVMDLLFNIQIIPSIVAIFLSIDHFSLIIVSVCNCFNIIGRPLFTASICVDCYMAVVQPIMYMRIKRGRYRVFFCVLIWFVSVVAGVLYYMFQNQTSLLVLIIPDFFTVLVIFFCDVAILRVLKKPDPSGRSDIHPQKEKALQTIISSLVMTLVSYLPPMVVVAVSPLLGLSRQTLTCTIIVPALISVALRSTVMPLLFLSNLGHLRALNRFVFKA